MDSDSMGALNGGMERGTAMGLVWGTKDVNEDDDEKWVVGGCFVS